MTSHVQDSEHISHVIFIINLMVIFHLPIVEEFLEIRGFAFQLSVHDVKFNGGQVIGIL